MEWYCAFKYRPRHGTQIWLWNKSKHRQEIFNAFWEENAWDAHTFPSDYSPMWSYVFKENEPVHIQPERLNPESDFEKFNDSIIKNKLKITCDSLNSMET